MAAPASSAASLASALLPSARAMVSRRPRQQGVGTGSSPPQLIMAKAAPKKAASRAANSGSTHLSLLAFGWHSSLVVLDLATFSDCSSANIARASANASCSARRRVWMMVWTPTSTHAAFNS